MPGGLVLPTDDVVGIAERVKFGDPVVGWRGDPQADTYLDPNTGQVAVYTFDGHGNRYCATVLDINRAGEGWRHELLRRLRDGDWQRDDVVERRMEELMAPVKAKEAAHREKAEQAAEKLAWALKRDLGHLYSGTTKEYH